MFKPRLKERVGFFNRCGAAYLTGYTLRFHKKSKDGSAKWDAFHTGNLDDVVWGVLDRLTNEQFAKLDEIEGDYYRLSREVTFCEETVKAGLYVAKMQFINSDILPTDSYKKLVVDGARELKLPCVYIDIIETIPSKPHQDDTCGRT